SVRARSAPVMSILLGCVVTGASLTACSNETADATRSLDTFISAWRTGSMPGWDDQYQRLVAGLGTKTPELSAGEVSVDGDTATARVTVAWALGPQTRWQYDTTVRLTRSDGTWRVDASPATVRPDLADGERLVEYADGDTRASILDGNGQPITEAR